jgi:hypothetical protein
MKTNVLLMAAACVWIAGCMPERQRAGWDDVFSEGDAVEGVNDDAGGNPSTPVETRPGTGSIDILWVIDNSGSMCQQQRVLRDNFDRFIDGLDEAGLDFHIAVTTTHMMEPSSYPFEPVALPGHFQSTPQPVPGFDPACYYDLDANGAPDPQAGSQPVLDNIRAAVECTADPSQWQHLLTPDITALRCALHASYWSCSSGEVRPREEFFPPQGAYRSIPKVLRASDYRNGAGDLDVARLRRDFACMSLVGTRGYGFEKGLLAAVTALSPGLLSGPNSGFLRNDAMTGIIFVSDENDCSHDGTLNERASCGVAECTFRENEPDSPLLATDGLKAELLDNLSRVKNREVHLSQVLVASFHGRYQRYLEPRPEPACSPGFDIPYSCGSSLGRAYSGHRYDEFIRQFPRHYPTAQADQPLPGLICGDFGPKMGELASFFGDAAAGPRH